MAAHTLKSYWFGSHFNPAFPTLPVIRWAVFTFLVAVRISAHVLQREQSSYEGRSQSSVRAESAASPWICFSILTGIHPSNPSYALSLLLLVTAIYVIIKKQKLSMYWKTCLFLWWRMFFRLSVYSRSTHGCSCRELSISQVRDACCFPSYRFAVFVTKLSCLFSQISSAEHQRLPRAGKETANLYGEFLQRFARGQ